MCVLFVLQHQVAAAAVSHSLSPDSHVSAASEGIRTDLADLEKKKKKINIPQRKNLNAPSAWSCFHSWEASARKHAERVSVNTSLKWKMG